MKLVKAMKFKRMMVSVVWENVGKQFGKPLWRFFHQIVKPPIVI